MSMSYFHTFSISASYLNIILIIFLRTCFAKSDLNLIILFQGLLRGLQIKRPYLGSSVIESSLGSSVIGSSLESWVLGILH